MIRLEIQDLQWIKGIEDDPEDHCAHGRVLFVINNTEFVKPDDGVWTISASGLFLLRTLTENHTVYDPVTENNFLFPCCGFSVWPYEGRFNVCCYGCNQGIDCEVIHQKGLIEVRNSINTEIVYKSDWVDSVLLFADTVRNYYENSKPKLPIECDLDRQGWTIFWQEWNDRYLHAKQSLEKTIYK